MAARWRGKDGDLNVDNSDFLAPNICNEFVLSRGEVEDHMDTHSCTDHSILAIFEDSAVPSEGKSGVEESETLLSALSDMLDSVEDDDGTLSPFDVLPDATFLNQPQGRDKSAVGSLSDRPRQRPKSANVTFTPKRDGEKEDKNRIPQLFAQQHQTLLHSNPKKAENEVEVFTSTSLVNLVRLMHPYCLKLHVEEGDKLTNNHALFSKEEVWRYERPSEESDEEINVVSDDEEPLNEAKGRGAGDEGRNDSKLKSVLLNRNSPRAACREKKRVSFGPVQVASFNEPAEKALTEKNPTNETPSASLAGTKALGNPAESALTAHTAPSSEMSSDKAEPQTPKGETKAKSLSLQQYRQLRQKRQPLVEKQGNYTTKWPSVPESPKELPPILGLQGQRRNSCGPKTAQHCPSNTRVSAHHLRNPASKTTSSHHTPPPPRPNPSHQETSSHTKPSRAETKPVSLASYLPDTTTCVNVPERKRNPAKKLAFLSSDPPNPVLVPLPISQTDSPSKAPSSSQSKSESLVVDSSSQSTTHFQSVQQESSAVSPQRQAPSSSSSSSSEPKSQVSLVNQTDTAPLQEMNKTFTETASDISHRPPALCPPSTRPQSASGCSKIQLQEYSLSPTKGCELEPRASQSSGPDPARHVKCPSSTPRSIQPPSAQDTHVPLKEEVAPEVSTSISSPQEPPSSLQVGSRGQRAASDSGIEASDLTSLLEQFEETQAKAERVEKNNSPAAPPSNTHLNGHVDVTRNGSEKTSGVPPSTPSVEPVKPVGASEDVPQPLDIPEPLGTEIILSTPPRRKTPPTKAIQIIDPRPLPPKKAHVSLSEPPAAHSSPHMYSAVSCDHDYCGPMDQPLTSRLKPSLLKDTCKLTNDSQVTSSDSSAAAGHTQPSTGQAESAPQPHPEKPRTNPPADRALQFSGRSEEGDTGEAVTAPCMLPTPPPSPVRGRQKRRYRRRAPRSDSSSSCSSSSSSSSSSSASRSPKRQKLHRRRSESSSSSSSPCRSMSHSPPRRYRLSYSRSRCSRSRSRSWSRSRSPSRSRSRSPSPQICQRRWKDVYSSSSSRESRKLRREHEMRIQKLKAIDERRVVYVGRIRSSMTHDELRERFSQFGEVECVSLHFRDRGDHYGFVTFYNMEDAFAAIDNGMKIRKPDELPFDICFGGRRQFCNSNYADLDANRDADPPPPRSRFEDLDFDSLLQQAQRGLKR